MKREKLSKKEREVRAYDSIKEIKEAKGKGLFN